MLMTEVESLEGISVRELALETERYNMITACNAAEGLQLFRKFINVDAVIVLCQRAWLELRRNCPAHSGALRNSGPMCSSLP